MHEPPRLDGERVRLSAPDETGGAAQEVEAEYDVAHSADEMHAGLEVAGAPAATVSLVRPRQWRLPETDATVHPTGPPRRALADPCLKLGRAMPRVDSVHA